MPPATVEVKVFSDLRVLLDGQRRRAAADESASGQAAQPPDEVEAAGGGPSGKEPRRRSLPQGVTTALAAHANKETTSPSDMLSPCSEVLLRRKGLVDVQVDQMAFARSLESVRVAPSSPGTQLRAGIPPDVDSSGLDGENPLRSPLDELRSPLAALGSSSHSNTPRKRAAKSFGETAKAAEAQPSPSALRSKAQEIMPRLRDAGRSSFLPAEVEEEEAQYNDENASALPQGPTPKIAARDKLALAEQDGTVFRMLYGEHETLPLPEANLATDDGDNFFVLPDDLSAADSLPSKELLTFLHGAEAAAKSAHQPPRKQRIALLGLTAVATTLAVVAGFSMSARRR
mmetsp:Transcript_47639/g.111184  ORF Transcript_47639/g.111184 Transcript_47639/m.111184 type:complete len:344 (-) Transcript_47639:189-1220(-)